MFSYNHLELSSQILLSIYVAALKIYPSHPQQVLITDPSCSSLTLTTTSVPWSRFPVAVPSQWLSEQGYMETRLFLQHLWLEDSPSPLPKSSEYCTAFQDFQSSSFLLSRVRFTRQSIALSVSSPYSSFLPFAISK